MVSSSKKKRGKQRKAAKSAAAASTPETSSLDPNNVALVHTPQGATYYHPTHHKLAALYVQKGDNRTTESMTKLSSEDVSTFGIGQPNISLVQSGVLSTVLDFLGRCENETFDKVMVGAKGHVFTPNGALISNVGGDLESPLVWINVLVRAAHIEPNCMLQIAENIGPLVKCMCNDTQRLFFQSNIHWREGIVRFVELVVYIILARSSESENPDKKVISTLLKHEGLLTSIIQWGFWGENRPDISKELNSIPMMGSSVGGATNITWTISLGKTVMKKLIAYTSILKDDNGGLTNEAKDRLRTIGCTPIISRSYDASCMVSYTAGLIRHIKTAGWDGADLSNLQYLIDADCVDKGVIKEVISLGFVCVENAGGFHNIDENVFLTLSRLSAKLICSYEVITNEIHPSDTHISFAIRAGLIEMCLSFLEYFVEHYLSSTVSIYNFIGPIFNIVQMVSLHKKTAKAIKHKRSSIEDMLVRLELEENTDITSNTEYKKLLDMIRVILDINGSYCCRCNKSLTKTEVMECNGCSRMSYCSRACQREDWFNGHSVTCCKSFTNETAGQFQGRYWPRTTPDDERAAAKLGDLEINSSMVHLKLFLDNSETILSQAEGLGIPLYDCVACFDLRACPITVIIAKYTDFHQDSSWWKGFEDSRSKENIMCVYSHIFVQDESDELLLQMQRMFPHAWLLKQQVTK